jgi:hypothetical protein
VLCVAGRSFPRRLSRRLAETKILAGFRRTYPFFSDKPDLQWAIKYITLVFLFGVATFAVSYIMLLLATIEVDQSLARSSEQNEWEKILWAQPQKTAAEYGQSAQRAYLIAILFGGLSALCFLGGLGWVMQEILYL